MESNETLPEGFVQIVDCCQFCIHSNTGEHLQLLGWCNRHDICVGNLHYTSSTLHSFALGLGLLNST